MGVDVAIAVGTKLRDPRIVEMADVLSEDMDAAWTIFCGQPQPPTRRARPLSFTDCTSFAVMRRLGLKRALAFDEHFREQGFEVPGLV